MIRTMIESPLRGDYERNRAYARACMRHALLIGDAGFAMHLLYAQPGILDDTIPIERELGITAGMKWAAKAERVVLYTDLGITEGMERAVSTAFVRGIPVEYRHGVWSAGK
jgi:hypothetical protein